MDKYNIQKIRALKKIFKYIEDIYRFGFSGKEIVNFVETVKSLTLIKYVEMVGSSKTLKK